METFAAKNRRGLSTVVTSAILLSAVAVLGAGLVTWSQSNLSSHQQSLELDFSKKTNKLNEFLIIEHVWFGTTPSNNVNITMNNVGTVSLNIAKISIKDTAGTTVSSYPYGDFGTMSGGTLSVNETFPWVADTAYDVIVETDRGSQYKTQVTAPT